MSSLSSKGTMHFPRPVGLRGRLLAAIWVSAFLVSVDYTALNVALPTLARAFGVGTSSISWIALSYMLVMVALTLVTGPVIDRFGYKRALMGALAIFAGASLAGALASSFWLIVGSRAAQGIGASVMFVIGPAIIKAMFASEDQDRAFAIFSTAPTAGLCAGPALGGQLTALFGWPSVFLFSAAVAGLGMALLQAAPRTAADPGGDPNPAARGPAPLTAGLAFAGLLALVLALNQGQEWGWQSPAILALLGSSCIALVAVLVRDRSARTPLINWRIFAAGNLAASTAVLFPLLVVFGGSVFLMPFYFEWLRKVDAAVVGRLLMVQPIATIAVSILAGFLLSGASRRALCFAGICLLAGGVAVLATADRDAPGAVLVLALALMGAGAGLYYPTLIQLGMSNVPVHLAASASGLQTTVRVLAQLIGVVLLETIFSQLYPLARDATLAAAVQGPALAAMQSAFQAVFWCGTALAAGALLLTFALRRPLPLPLSPPRERGRGEGAALPGSKANENAGGGE
jgi:MFS family permease